MRRWLVRDVMTADVIAVREETGYKEIAETLARFAVSSVPVIDEDRLVLGVVSEADLLHKIEFTGIEPHLRIFERKRERAARAKAAGDTAGGLMTAPPITIGPDESVTSAARMLEERQLKRLPVVDTRGRLIGIVSRRDLLRVYLRPDDELRTEIVEQVLRGTLWLTPGEIDVTVSQGVVTLSGTVDRRTTVDLIVRLMQTVAGVIDVVNALTYRRDDREEVHHHYVFDAEVRSS